MDSEEYRETPPTIRSAVNFLWIAFGLSLAKSAWLYFQMKNVISSTSVFGGSIGSNLILSTVVANLVVGLISLFVLDKVSGGKNWARVVVAVIFALSLLNVLFTVGGLIKNPIQPGILSVFSIGFSAYALLLLFGEPGKFWFRRPSTDSQ